jgi:IS1 family transposase
MQKSEAARVPHLWGQMQTNQYRMTRGKCFCRSFAAALKRRSLLVVKNRDLSNNIPKQKRWYQTP